MWNKPWSSPWRTASTAALLRARSRYHVPCPMTDTVRPVLPKGRACMVGTSSWINLRLRSRIAPWWWSSAGSRELAEEGLHVAGDELRLLPFEEVAAGGRFREVHDVVTAFGPFAWRRR